MRLRFVVLGREIWSVEFNRDDADVVECNNEPTMGGGSGHNFERDCAPISPDDRYAPWGDRGGFGFVR
ncbi:hypothetical protein [Mycolicibacter kumamotonensis]|uniref:hypothetical protein n=1 Tax=Mycolicibacter kumamotonensis TaxID=354243 RepID=UPI0010566B0C|nr:hypothetical protein [Mycolicibacter kumamotonensis]